MGTSGPGGRSPRPRPDRERDDDLGPRAGGEDDAFARPDLDDPLPGAVYDNGLTVDPPVIIRRLKLTTER